MLKYRRLRLLSYLVIAYMLIALSWWSVLLYTKNSDAFHAKTELLRIGMVAEGVYESEAVFQKSPAYLNLEKKYSRQEYMILGEALVFIITLIIGIWFINRGYNKEIEASQQRRNFLLSITHELKSPLASIRLILETFRKRVLNPGQSARLVRSGLEEAERLHQLVNNLLLSARLETAFQPIFEKINIQPLITEIIRNIQEKYPETNFQLHIAKDVQEFEADRTGLISILINLIENAAKYSEQPGNVDIDISATKSAVAIKIADQGIGIPDQEKTKIFSQFYRLGNEDTRKTKGTGLGLYIVDQIVDSHQGSITVTANQPKGSIFAIELPRKQQKI